jgi:integrase
MLFAEWLERWHGGRHHLRESSRARDRSYFNSLILPHLAAVPLAHMSPELLRTWVAKLVAGGKAPATVVKALQLVSGALEAAVADRLIASNGARHVAAPLPRPAEMMFLEPDEVQRLAETIDPRYGVFVWFLVLTGVRFGEAAALETSDLDMLRRTVTISKTASEVRGRILVGSPKTAAGRRRITLPESLVDDLAEHLAARPAGSTLVFSAPEGGHLRRTVWRRRAWLPAIQAAGLEGLRVHDLRHTAVAWLIAAGEHPVAIARRLGHASVSTILDRYGHLLPGLDEGTASALDRIRAAATSRSAGRLVQMRDG